MNGTDKQEMVEVSDRDHEDAVTFLDSVKGEDWSLDWLVANAIARHRLAHAGPVGEALIDPVAWLYVRGGMFPVSYFHSERTEAYLRDGEDWTEIPLYTHSPDAALASSPPPAVQRDGKLTMTVRLSEEEMTVLDGLLTQQELSRDAMFRQMLRIYQNHALGLYETPPPIAVATLFGRLCQVVRHAENCPARQGNGDADCTCDAVAALSDAERMLGLPKAAPQGELREALDEVRGKGEFLLARIDELDWSVSYEEFGNSWSGHVDPALSRFRAALASQGVEG